MCHFHPSMNKMPPTSPRKKKRTLHTQKKKITYTHVTKTLHNTLQKKKPLHKHHSSPMCHVYSTSTYSCAQQAPKKKKTLYTHTQPQALWPMSPPLLKVHVSTPHFTSNWSHIILHNNELSNSLSQVFHFKCLSMEICSQ